MAGLMAGEDDKHANELLEYKKDSRTACKYGSECYQKNPLHNKKYKHPPKSPKRKLAGTMMDPQSNVLKKQKRIDSSSKARVVAPKKDYKDKAFELENSGNQAKREEISDSDTDTAQSSKNIERDKKKESGRKQSEVVPDSDSDSPSSQNGEKVKAGIENKCMREQISDSESESSFTESVTKRQVIEKSVDEPTDSKPHAKQQQTESEQNCLALLLPQDVKKLIKQMFLMEMPEDFYDFWAFCKSLSSNNPAAVFKDVGLLLVGPYDVLSGNLRTYDPTKRNLYITHWRYYFDPPEFQTLIKGDDKTQFHMGYYRDDPTTLPSFVASNCAAKDGTIIPMAENIFGAVNSFLESAQKTSNPFQKVKLSRLQKVLQSWANSNDYTLDVVTPSMKLRDRKVVAKTFHRAGIVVPVERKTELGYRELIETDARLKKILKFIVESRTDQERNIYLEKLQPIITAANIANDECDFGTSLELGIDLFSMGGAVLHGSALQLLTTAYTLLKRPEFKEIIEAHLKNRRKGSALSMLEIK